MIAIAKRLNLRGSLHAAVGNDPLEHANSILELLDLGPQSRILHVVAGALAHLAHRAGWDAQFVPDDGEGEHQDEYGQDELERIHSTFSTAKD
jgi:hypothetical protein